MQYWNTPLFYLGVKLLIYSVDTAFDPGPNGLTLAILFVVCRGEFEEVYVYTISERISIDDSYRCGCTLQKTVKFT